MIHSKLQQRYEKAVQNQFDLNTNKIEIFDQVDKFFDEMQAQVEKRRSDLKNEYTKIETREKRRLKNKQLKLQKEIALVEEFQTDFSDFINDYDFEMDYLANKASFEEGYKKEY